MLVPKLDGAKASWCQCSTMDSSSLSTSCLSFHHLNKSSLPHSRLDCLLNCYWTLIIWNFHWGQLWLRLKGSTMEWNLVRTKANTESSRALGLRSSVTTLVNLIWLSIKHSRSTWLYLLCPICRKKGTEVPLCWWSCPMKSGKRRRVWCKDQITLLDPIASPSITPQSVSE